MKKLPVVLATAGLTASMGVFAAFPTDAAPFQVVVPNLKSGFDITFEGLYLQPTNSDLDYATVSGFTSSGDGTTITGNVNVKTVDPDYNFGFRVGLGYTFQDSGNDVQLSWTHFDNNDSASFTVPNEYVMISRLGVPFPVGIGSIIFDDDEPGFDSAYASSEAKTKLDSIDLDVGQYVDIGTRLRMRMFAGLRVAQVRSDLNNHYQGMLTTEELDDDELITEELTVTGYENFNSKFTGIGPRFGVDSAYHIGNCFGVVGHASFALLVGQTKTDTNFHYNATTLENGEFDESYDVNGYINSDDTTRVVPVLDAKLGLDFSHEFDNGGVLTIEGGYQWTQYIDAIDRLDTGSSVLEPIDDGEMVGLSSAVNVERTTSSVGFNGPYLSLNWKV